MAFKSDKFTYQPLQERRGKVSSRAKPEAVEMVVNTTLIHTLNSSVNGPSFEEDPWIVVLSIPTDTQAAAYFALYRPVQSC